MSHTILIGTNNQGKLKEFKDALSSLSLQFTSPAEMNLQAEIAETGKTFTQNALLKAKAWAQIAKLPTLVDDSGLCVDALNGKPGIYSARFVPGNDQDRNAEILKLLNDVPFIKRTAHYVCVIAFIDPVEKIEHLSEGFCEGHILKKAQGDGGFGYDPIFQPLGYNESFGKLPMKIKQKISHRAKALANLSSFLQQWVKS